MPTTRRTTIRRHLGLGLLTCLLAVAPAPRARAQLLEFGIDAVENPVVPLAPKQPRSERDQDHVHAAAQYAHGRMLMRRNELATALHCFERAYRYDPQPHIAQEVIALATTLKQPAEAVRYAILSAERHGGEPRLVRQLAEILVGQGELARAAALYERVLHASPDSPPGSPPDPTEVLVRAELGRIYLVTGKFDQAEPLLTVLKDALEEPDKFGFSGQSKSKLLAEEPRLYPLIGEGYFRMGKLDAAEAMFRKAHEGRSNEPLLAFQLARIAVERKDWITAEKQLDTYFTSKSAIAAAEPYELLSRVVAGRFSEPQRAQTELVTRLAQLREQQPDNSFLGYALAAQLAAAGKEDQAEQQYWQLLESQPNAEGFHELAKILQRRKNAEGLIRLLGRLVETAGMRGSLGSVGEQLAESTELLDQMVKSLSVDSPASAGYAPCVGVALLALNVGRVEIADKLYQQALRQPEAPAARIHEIIGLGAMVSEQPELAATALRKCVEGEMPRDKLAPLYYYLAGAEALAGHSDAALEAAEKCASLAPDSAQFRSRPAWVLYYAKRTAEAERRYLELLSHFDRLYQDNEVREQVRQMRMILSNICVIRGQLPEAEEWLEQVLDEFPEDVGAYNDLGYLWVDQKKHLNRALAMCERAVREEPDNGAYRDSLGWAYFRHGRFDEAVKELEEAARLTPDGVIYDHLGDAYAKSNQLDKAQEAWRKAVELFTKESELEKSRLTAAKIEFATRN